MIKYEHVWGLETRFVESPILLKLLEAVDQLSIQVHPNAKCAAKHGVQMKTEVWCVINPGDIYAGFKLGVTLEDVKKASGTDAILDLLVKRYVKKGEIYLIPAGVVHSLGGGVSVFEVQQPSDITYRFFDWHRKRVDGSERELHIEKALEAVDVSATEIVPVDKVENEFFSAWRVEAAFLDAVDYPRYVYTPSTGEFKIVKPGERQALFDWSFVAAAR